VEQVWNKCTCALRTYKCLCLSFFSLSLVQFFPLLATLSLSLSPIYLLHELSYVCLQFSIASLLLTNKINTILTLLSTLPPTLSPPPAVVGRLTEEQRTELFGPDHAKLVMTGDLLLSNAEFKVGENWLSIVFDSEMLITNFGTILRLLMFKRRVVVTVYILKRQTGNVSEFFVR
jgi:hypothetical protein